MKLKRGRIISVLFVLILIFNSAGTGRNRNPGLKAYLIYKSNSSFIQNDSLLQKNLRQRLSSALKKKNIIMVSNDEMETAGRPHLYIYVSLNDSLRISAMERGTEGLMTITVPKDEKVYSYKNDKDVVSKVIAYSRKYLLKH